jgi:hypothetical protein
MITKIFSIIFGGIGAAFLVVTLIFVASNVAFLGEASVANGTVIQLQLTDKKSAYQPVITFSTTTGQQVQFTDTVASNPPQFTVGQSVKVYYKPDDPAGSARVDSLLSFWFLPGLFGIFTLVFGGIGTGFFTAGYLKRQKQKWLQLNGQTVTAEITDVQLNRGVRVNGKSPYIIFAQWYNPENKLTYSFKSDSIWQLPANLAPGSTINVMVDPRNFKRYRINI